MRKISLGLGKGSFDFDYSDERFEVLTGTRNSETPISDIEIGSALDSPISSPPLDEIVGADDSVLLVVSDATRATASAQIVNLLVRRLIQTGVSPGNIAVIFATGIHRSVTEQEKLDLLTPFIVQRIRTMTHDAYDSNHLTLLGTTERGIPIEVNKALTEFSKVILIGGISFHYFAGFTGGRKSICPGLASAKTIASTHMLALDFEKGGRRVGVGTGLLEGNAVHAECEKVAQLIAPAFGINTIVNDQKLAVEIYCGDWRIAHRAGCEAYLQNYSIEIEEKRDLVVVSCGGFPHDINLIQAHKALDMAAYACNDGGTIVLLAECADGFGRSDFLKWFDSKSSADLEERLKSEYEVNGQTAWSLLTKAERYRVHLVSKLDPGDVRKMRMMSADSITKVLEDLDAGTTGYIMPRGAAFLPRVLRSSANLSVGA